MATGSGLLALAMLAAEGPACPPDDATTFQVKVITLDGLEWRSASYARLQPVGRQGTSTIWTADRALAASLTDRARTATSFPKFTATGDAVLTKSEVVGYVAAVDRVADGPINQSTSLAFMPRPERIEARFAMKVSGRKLDQGVLAKVALEESCVDALHDVPQTETVRPSSAKTSRTPTDVGREILNVVMSKDSGEPGQTITCAVQVPEISLARIDGEWLIPNDGVLLVSLGVKTVADEKGMAVVRERLAVIEAGSGTMPPTPQFSKVDAAPPAPFQYARLPMPAAPARSMPEPFDPNGNLVDLPPLPEAVASADLDRIKPAPNQPSPQAPVLPSPSATPDRDTELARTSFDAENSTGKRPAAGQDLNRQARRHLLERAIEALEKAGQDLDLEVVDVDFKELQPFKVGCAKCDVDEMECPLAASSTIPAGGIKLATEMTTQLGVTVKKPGGSESLEVSANLNEALKAPGRTETTVIPLGGKLALEIKATVVPASPEKAKVEEKKADSPDSPR